MISALRLILFILLLVHSSNTQAFDRKELSVSYEEYTCLAENIYHEARGEPAVGRIGVGFVVLNRVRSRHYRNTICGVVHARSQFSWTMVRYIRPPSGDGWRDAKKVAFALLQKGSTIKDPTYGALYYHKVGIFPRWTKGFRYAIRLGDHIFYPKGAV